MTFEDLLTRLEDLVCDVVDRVLKSPVAQLVYDINPVRHIFCVGVCSSCNRVLCCITACLLINICPVLKQIGDITAVDIAQSF